MNLLITPGTFVHQMCDMSYGYGDGVFIAGPTNENTMLAMNTMSYGYGDGVFLVWLYY